MTSATHTSTPARRTEQTGDWIVSVNASRVPVLSAHARAKVADHLAEALVRDYRHEHGPNDGLRLVPRGGVHRRRVTGSLTAGTGSDMPPEPFGELATAGPKAILWD